MRIQKDYVIIAFSTTTSAMAMEKLCAEKNIPGRLIPLPTEISAGCGLSWRIPADDYINYDKKINDLGIEFESVTELKM